MGAVPKILWGLKLTLAPPLLKFFWVPLVASCQEKKREVAPVFQMTDVWRQYLVSVPPILDPPLTATIYSSNFRKIAKLRIARQCFFTVLLGWSLRFDCAITHYTHILWRDYGSQSSEIGWCHVTISWWPVKRPIM